MTLISTLTHTENHSLIQLKQDFYFVKFQLILADIRSKETVIIFIYKNNDIPEIKMDRAKFVEMCH